MDRYLVVQRVGDGLIAMALPVGVLLIFYENEEAGIWIVIGCVLIGGVLSWLGHVRKDP